jgi:hypothetical protein
VSKLVRGVRTSAPTRPASAKTTPRAATQLPILSEGGGTDGLEAAAGWYPAPGTCSRSDAGIRTTSSSGPTGPVPNGVAPRTRGERS